MNERIKELAGLAYQNVISNTPSFLVTKEMFHEKFATLLIQECINICTKGDIEKPMGLMYSKQIKKHFGVKE